MKKKTSKNKLLEFKTIIAHKIYTKCDKNIIIGSNECKKCSFFINKISYNNTNNKIITHYGIVECSK